MPPVDSVRVAVTADVHPTYQVTDLGTLGGTDSVARAINDSGQVTGYAATADGAHHAFLWNGSAMQDLGTLGGTDSFGYAINAKGQVTGYASTAGDAETHAFLWNGSAMQDLGTLGGTRSFGYAINANGQVTGDAATAGMLEDEEVFHAFLWNGSAMQDLGTLGGSQSADTSQGSHSSAINAKGQVTGWASTTFSDTEGFYASHAFLWNGSAMQDLGTVEGSTWGFAGGVAINDKGQVTGAGYFHAFLWDGSVMQDLNDLIRPPQPSITLARGVAINDRGQIAANDEGYGDDGNRTPPHAYLVAPAPPGTATTTTEGVSAARP
jgi:probable HAF family extracellular repeat protein